MSGKVIQCYIGINNVLRCKVAFCGYEVAKAMQHVRSSLSAFSQAKNSVILQICIFLVAQLFIPFTSFGQQVNDFEIIGKIKGLEDGANLYLIQNSTKDTVAKARVKKNNFQMKGRVPNGTEYYYLKLDTFVRKERSSALLLVNGSLVLNGNISQWPYVELLGSTPHKEYLEVVTLWSQFDSELKKIDSLISDNRKAEGAARSAGDSSKIGVARENEKMLNQAKKTVQASRIKRVKDFIYSHSNSLYIADLIKRMMRQFPLTDVQEMYDRLSFPAKSSYFGQILARDISLIQQRNKIGNGKVIPDFYGVTPNGKSLSVLDLAKKGTITLIDFWASWCKPCRAEVPNMKNVYETFHSKGFNIIGVSLDEKEDRWIKALHEDSTQWVHIRDTSMATHKIFDLPYIPAFALVDGEGKLLAFSAQGSAVGSFGPQLQGEKLMETIDSILISKAGSANEIKVDAAQAFKALRVGDKVPDISLGEIVNHPHLTKAKFSDFKGKLLILDFWSTWCSVCISLFPRMETLQKQFGDNVVILPVGFDAGKEGSIKQFLESKRNTPQALNLPCAIQKPKDTTLMALFPFSGLPHEVWIDASGRVIGITDHHAVNADNISRILNGIIPKFSVKKVTRRILPENETLLLKNRGTFGSAFAGYIDSFSTVNSFGLVYKFDSSCLSYYGINQTVYSFYKFAYRDSIPDISDKRIVVEHNGKPFYKKRADIKSTDNWSYDEFKQSNLFAYELILPASYDVKKVNQFLIDDFDKYFQIQSKVERRKTKCLALVKFPSGNYSPINTNHQGVDADRDNFTFSQRLQYSNIPVRQFIDELDNYLMTSYPIVDESNLSIVNISLPKKKQYTISEMKVELRKYGLDLIFVEREMDILVLYNVRKS